MKSKIEEKIEKAREATNEMFAAFNELNERLSAKIEPKFAEGEFVRTFDGYIFKVSHKTLNTQKTEWLYCKNPNVTYFGNYIEESKLEKWTPKDGEYYKIKDYDYEWICIARVKETISIKDFVSVCKKNGILSYDSRSTLNCLFYPATPEEIALLDSKLAEQGKRFDKEKLELVDIPKFKEGDYFVLKMGRDKDGLRWLSSMESYIDKILIIDKISKNGNIINKEVGYYFHPDWCEKTTAPKHKEPIIGEMAIGWSGAKHTAIIGIYQRQDVSSRPYLISSSWFDNAILFESPKQYKAFLKS